MGLHAEIVTAIAPEGTERVAAFQREVLPEADRLFGLALTVLGDRGEAEDVVQETLVTAWRARSSLRDPGRLAAWLTRICVRHAIHRRRALLHRRILWAGQCWAREETASQPSSGRLADVQRAFRSLSAPQRAVFTLHHVDGLTLAECAAAMGCRPGTARSHLGRAMAKLRRELIDA